MVSFWCRSIAGALATVVLAAGCAGPEGPRRDEPRPEGPRRDEPRPEGPRRDEPRPVAGTAPTGTGETVDAARRLDHGIDVSSHSGAVDWERVRDAGTTFAVVKASEGVDLPDPAHDAHWEGAERAGLLRGAYHFFVTEDDPEEQARLFLSVARLAPGDLAPVVDVELIGHGTPPGLEERLRRFLEILEERYGVPPIIYTRASFWNRQLPPTFGDYPLWVAHYGVDKPEIPHGWSDWHLWQYEDDAAFGGVEKDADLTRANPARDDLHRLVIPPSPALEP